MLSSKRGSIYRTVLAGFIALAFCFALLWPWYAKHRNVAELSKAADLGHALAFAEESYKQVHGQYTAQFAQLDLSLPCPVTASEWGSQLTCTHYIYHLEGDRIIKAENRELPLWLEIDIPAGTVACKYAENDWAGQDLCARMQ